MRYMLVFTSLFVAGAAMAQEKSEAQAAAEALLTKDAIPVEYSVRGASGRTFQLSGEAQPSKSKMIFFGGRDPCFSGSIKTSFAAKDGVLIFTMHPEVTGCSAVQYRFNPVTKAGEVWAGAPGSELAKSELASIRIK